MKGVNPHDEIKGSNPSPRAYFKGIGEYYKIQRKQKFLPNLDLKHKLQQPIIMNTFT
jgi:hypothetical protein